MKKILFAIIIILTVLTGCSNDKTTGLSLPKEGKIGEDVPIMRYQVAKMLALSLYDINTIENMERTIVFEDTTVDEPYDKYINAAYKGGLISGADETHFQPDTYLSLEQAQFLLNKLDKTGTLKLQYNHEDRKKPISAAMWTEVFEKAMSLSGNTNIVSGNIVQLATGQNCSVLGDRFIMTDRGLLSYEVLGDYIYNDCTLNILLRDKEVLAYKAVVNTEPSITGATVIATDEEGVRLDLGGVERYFYYKSPYRLVKGDNINFTYCENSITEVEGKTVADVSYS